jgi:hypothetical protein
MVDVDVLEFVSKKCRYNSATSGGCEANCPPDLAGRLRFEQVNLLGEKALS